MQDSKNGRRTMSAVVAVILWQRNYPVNISISGRTENTLTHSEKKEKDEDTSSNKS